VTCIRTPQLRHGWIKNNGCLSYKGWQAAVSGDSVPSRAKPPSASSGSGVHTGEVELRGDDVSGIAVHIAARVATTAAAGEVLVSRTVADLIAGSEVQLTDRGEQELKGIPERWRLVSADLK
jgi:class 3 adenylate cyclase